jgi:RES domain-containing protein
VRRFQGLVWRHVPVGAEPLHLGWILKGARGRWNTRRPRFPCLYTSLTPRGAIAEFEKHLAAYGGRRTRDLVSLQVSVGPVLDLTRPQTLRTFGLAPATLMGDHPRDLAACRSIARDRVLHGPYRAILAPSASSEGAVNLMIYLLDVHQIQELSNGPDRITIMPGFQWPEP